MENDATSRRGRDAANAPNEEVDRPSTPAARVADAVRNACVEAALDAYESAKLSGLCDEGAWEAAVGAMRMVDVDRIIEEVSGGSSRSNARGG